MKTLNIKVLSKEEDGRYKVVVKSATTSTMYLVTANTEEQAYKHTESRNRFCEWLGTLSYS